MRARDTNARQLRQFSSEVGRIVRAKKCKACRQVFTPTRKIQAACSIKCAVDLAIKKRAKVEAAELKRRKEAVKTRPELLREAQTAFNAFIRARDADMPCISCGRHHAGQYHAGHYLSTGARPELRFDESNVHKQCQPCNTHLHGNLVLYRIGLIKRIGLGKVEWLEGPHSAKKYTHEELRQIKASYAAKAKELARDEA